MVSECGPSRVSTCVSVPRAAWPTLTVERGVEVVALALEAGVAGHGEVDEERPTRATALARRAAVGESQGRPVLDAGGHLDGERALLHAAPLAAAVAAGVRDHLARAVATRAGDARHHLPEQGLAHPAQLAGPLAVEAGDRLGSRRRAAAGAGGAGDGKADGDLLAAAEDGLGEVQRQSDLRVRAGLGAPATEASAAAHLPEEGLEDVAQAALEAEAAHAARLGAEDALGAEAVVARPGARGRAGPRRRR